MKTKGGYEVQDFKKLETPINNGILEPHLYEGIVKDVPKMISQGESNWKVIGGEAEDMKITWDQFGRCSNWNREDCFIENFE